MIKIFTLLLVLLPIFSFGQTSELLFSEYGEGHSNNKFFEIYNGTGSTVDLSTYTVVLYTNGNSVAQSTLVLSGSLLNNATYIVANPSADITIKDLADTLHATCGYNGDDVLELRKNGVVIDVFGNVGVDPGTSWTIAGNINGGVDKVLTRKPTVCSPTADWALSFGTDSLSSQWTINPLIFNAANMPTLILGLAQHVVSLPIVSAGIEETVCAGTEVILAGSGALTYVWNNGVMDTVGFMATTTKYYKVIGTDVNGCMGTDSVQIIVNPLPVVTISTNGSLLTASLTTGVDYQWINCANNTEIAGADAQSYSATAVGSYKVEVIDVNGCVGESACQAVTQLGVEAKADLNTFNISPNPTKGKVTITVAGNESANVVIFNALGKEISKVNNIQNGSVIDFSVFNNGVYMVQITTSKGTKVQRVVKN
jgi:hypothetical protein